MSSVLLKCSALGPSAGKGAFAMAGYYHTHQKPRISSCSVAIGKVQWQAGHLFGPFGCREKKRETRTDVVLTPQSNAGVAGEGAGGVSIHSKFSSDVVLLILSMMERKIAKRAARNVGEYLAAKSPTAVCRPKHVATTTQSVDRALVHFQLASPLPFPSGAS